MCDCWPIANERHVSRCRNRRNNHVLAEGKRLDRKGQKGEVNEIRGPSLEIRAVTHDDLSSVLDVYWQCEDFLALGPEPVASMEMVLRDIETSQRDGGLFCGIFATDGSIVGVVDTVPSGFEGDPHVAFLSLLMIAAPHRNRGIGQAVVTLIKDEIERNPQVTTILSAVQVNNPPAVRFWQRNGYCIVGGPALQPDGTTTFRLRKKCIRRRNRRLDPAYMK